jgi:hypothetical protein
MQEINILFGDKKSQFCIDCIHCQVDKKNMYCKLKYFSRTPIIKGKLNLAILFDCHDYTIKTGK